MSHSTLHGFHYPVVIQSQRTGTSGVKHLNGGILQAIKDATLQFARCTDKQNIIVHFFLVLVFFIVPVRDRQVKTAWVDFSINTPPQNEPDQSSDLIC